MGKICPICGQVFFGMTEQVECSSGCQYLNSLRCLNCSGRLPYIYPAHRKTNHGLYCSAKCKKEYHQATFTKSPINKYIRTLPQYEEWRKKCFIRDAFTCQSCKVVGGHLEVHHKQPVKTMIRDIQANLPDTPIREAILIYQPLWDISNGITLCRECHKQTF